MRVRCPTNHMEAVMIGSFIFGFFVGGVTGVIAMALVVAAGRDDER